MKAEILIFVIVALCYPSSLNGWPLTCKRCPHGKVCTLKPVPCLIAPCPEIARCTDCPAGLVFNSCGSPCPRTCDDPNPVCIERCDRGCFCPDSTPIEHDGNCIREDQCPPKKCPNGQPLKDSNGDEIFCGRGPARQDCPDSHVCNIHPADVFAVCCPKPDPPPTCENKICPPGHFCELKEVVCKKAPCHPVPTCVAKCPRGRPLLGPDGDELFCGMGPSSRPCPPTHVCTVHPTDRFAVCCPKQEPVCPRGSPYKNPGSSSYFQCGGISGIRCPPGFDCLVTAPGADRFGVCCRQKPKFCTGGRPYMDRGRGITFQCGGIRGVPCPPGHTCVYDGSGPDRTGHCCPQEIRVCPRGASPLVDARSGRRLFQCGGIRNIRCPGGYTCMLDGPGIGRTGICCPNEGTVCPHGDPYKTTGPDGSMINFPCGGIAGIACPPNYNCVITAPGADRFGICCPPACPTGLVYNHCGTACPPTCEDPNPVCIERCDPGCFCPDNTPILHKGRCIRREDCPSTPPVCRHGDPYQTPGPHGNMVNFRCGGIAGISCPHGYDCVITAPGSDRFGICCPQAPVCRHGDPYQTPGPHGGMVNFRCGGIAGIRCPSGYDCVITAPGSDRFGTCCPQEKKVCPNGKPYVDSGTGKTVRCGGLLGLPCPSFYTCITPDGPVADLPGTCCLKENICLRGDPYTNPSNGRIFYCGGMMNVQCPAGYTCIGERPEIDQGGICCTEASRCFLPKTPGPCRGSFLRWYYDERSTDCLSFTYGGCQGNENRFSTAEECIDSCRCSLPKDPGPCKASMPVWYYDENDGTCKQFTYGGCHGNGNRFDSEEDCKATCPVGR